MTQLLGNEVSESLVMAKEPAKIKAAITKLRFWFKTVPKLPCQCRHSTPNDP